MIFSTTNLISKSSKSDLRSKSYDSQFPVTHRSIQMTMIRAMILMIFIPYSIVSTSNFAWKTRPKSEQSRKKANRSQFSEIARTASNFGPYSIGFKRQKCHFMEKYEEEKWCAVRSFSHGRKIRKCCWNGHFLFVIPTNYRWKK